MTIKENLRSSKESIKKWLIRNPALYENLLRLLKKQVYLETKVLRRAIQKGDTVFDVGANTGQFTPLFSNILGREGTLHVFEPIPHVFSKLALNVKNGDLPVKIFLNQCAVSDRSGFTSMHIPGEDSTQASLQKHHVSSWNAKDGSSEVKSYEKVRVITLDDYVKEHGIESVSFIKCDVEGAELLMLKGATTLLKKPKPPMLFLEVWAEWVKDFGYTPEDLFRFLSDGMGYHFVHLGNERLQAFSDPSQAIPGVFPNFLNYLCYVPAIHGNLIRSLLS